MSCANDKLRRISAFEGLATELAITLPILGVAGGVLGVVIGPVSLFPPVFLSSYCMLMMLLCILSRRYKDSHIIAGDVLWVFRRHPTIDALIAGGTFGFGLLGAFLFAYAPSQVWAGILLTVAAIVILLDCIWGARRGSRTAMKMQSIQEVHLRDGKQPGKKVWLTAVTHDGAMHRIGRVDRDRALPHLSEILQHYNIPILDRRKQADNSIQPGV